MYTSPHEHAHVHVTDSLGCDAYLVEGLAGAAGGLHGGLRARAARKARRLLRGRLRVRR